MMALRSYVYPAAPVTGDRRLLRVKQERLAS